MVVKSNRKDMAWAVEFKNYVYRVLFNCDKCGNCCRHILPSDEKKLPIKEGTTICRYLDEITNRCTIYRDRPDCCRLFPVYGGNERYKIDYCPEYKRFYYFRARRNRYSVCEPYGWYKKPRGKELITVYRLKGGRLTPGFLTGALIPVPIHLDEVRVKQ